MGNTTSSPPPRRSKSSSKRTGGSSSGDTDDVATRAQKIASDSVRELQAGIQNGIKRLEENDHPAAQLLDSFCGPYLDSDRRFRPTNSFASEDASEEDDSRTISEDETTTTDYRTRQHRKAHGGKREEDTATVGSASNLSHSDYKVDRHHSKSTTDESSYGTEDGEYRNGVAKKAVVAAVAPEVVAAGASLQKPLASAFAKRCYFTKAGIGPTTQHYEGLTLTGNVVLMLAAAMKLKGCPTICDEDLRRVEQTYPNQFSRLPDELLLSSGWRRISKYCHFSNKPIPDGIPFFHSKQRLHPSGGYYFLLAAAVGMVRPIDVEPLTRDTLVLLETDYPQQCDAAPRVLIQDPDQWTLVDKFCFFSGGPINTDEDVYYQADFDGNPIYMLAFLSPSLTPAELYKLEYVGPAGEPGLRSVVAVEEVESVYDLTERDFDDLKLYHLGPCRALPPYILQPQAWAKVLPPHFVAARQTALLRAQEYETRVTVRPMTRLLNSAPTQLHQTPTLLSHMDYVPHVHSAQPNGFDAAPYASRPPHQQLQQQLSVQLPSPPAAAQQQLQQQPPAYHIDVHQQMEEDTDYLDPPVPMDEAIDTRAHLTNYDIKRMDPPEDEPPSLSRPQQSSSYQSSAEESVPRSYYEQTQSQEVATRSSDYYSSEKLIENHVFEDPAEEEKYFLDEPQLSVDIDEPPEQEQEEMDDPDDPWLSPVTQEELSPGPSIDEPLSPQDPSPSRMERDLQLPPRSPTTDYSPTSAMRGAQEVLRRNRQRRQEDVRSRQGSQTEEVGPDDEHNGNVKVSSPRGTADSESVVTWESSSEITSVSGSSCWTESTNNPDRSSRRALILQMAKARMKSTTKTTPKAKSKEYEEEEKKLDAHQLNTAPDIDLTSDLD